MNESALKASEIYKSFILPDANKLTVLKGASFNVKHGEIVAIMGVSGSGKTTLLHILAGIEPLDRGIIQMSNPRIGLIFQQHYLLSELDAGENIALAARLHGVSSAEATKRAVRLLQEVGLSERRTHLPSELSGGEMARVAIARALATDPDIILADEPTGNLDEETSLRVQELLFGTVHRLGKAMIIVTHEPMVAGRADRTLRLEHGLLQ